MKTYNRPKFELVSTLNDIYCAGTIETENVSSATAGNGGIHQVVLPNDPLGNLK